MRAQKLAVLAALVGFALGGCGTTLQPERSQPDSGQPQPDAGQPQPDAGQAQLDSAQSEPDSTQPPLTPEAVTFELENDTASTLWLYQGCLLEMTITELSEPPHVIGRPDGCGVCDCAIASCPPVACGVCFQGGLEVAPASHTTYAWSSIDMTYETRGNVQCSHTRVLPAGHYRVDVPVYTTLADATAKLGARFVSKTFELPATETIVIPLTGGALGGS